MVKFIIEWYKDNALIHWMTAQIDRSELSFTYQYKNKMKRKLSFRNIFGDVSTTAIGAFVASEAVPTIQNEGLTLATGIKLVAAFILFFAKTATIEKP